MFKCSCNNCDEHLEYPADYEGNEIKCPHCDRGTLLRQPQEGAVQSPPSSSGALAPPAMGSHGRAKTVLDSDDPLADAVPHDMLQSTDAAAKGAPDPFSCESCGAAMMPEDKVCVECGDRRSLGGKWANTKVFRLVAGIILGCEFLVLGLQWTTTGKPFGLRKRTRHAVKVKLGLAEEVKLAQAVAHTGGTNSLAFTPVAKDPDLVLTKHELKPDKNNGAMYIHGTVKNVSEYRYLAVKIKFRQKDRAGSAIPGVEVVFDQIRAIEPGKTWEFKVLLLDPDATGYEPILPVEGYR